MIDNDSSGTGEEASAWPPLADVSELSIADIRDVKSVALARSLARVVKSLDDPNGVMSAFQSYASPDE